MDVTEINERWARLLWRVGWVLLTAMVLHVVALAVTGDEVNGPVSLRKPATFAETSWLLCWSVSLALGWLELRAWQVRFLGVSVLAFGVGETAIMAIQAWRGAPSHYNFTTTFDATLMRGGAAGLAVVLLAGLVVLLLGVRRSAAPASVRLGIGAGTGVLFVGCVIGFAMISNMSGVFQGALGSGFGPPQNRYLGPPESVVGTEWLSFRAHTDGGDLVLLHAIGVHAARAARAARDAADAVRSPGGRPAAAGPAAVRVGGRRARRTRRTGVRAAAVVRPEAVAVRRPGGDGARVRRDSCRCRGPVPPPDRRALSTTLRGR